jgi:dephospho-CoA kinase
MFATLGVAVIDTDVIAREVVQPGEPALDEIRAEFGDQVILESG